MKSVIDLYDLLRIDIASTDSLVQWLMHAYIVEKLRKGSDFKLFLYLLPVVLETAYEKVLFCVNLDNLL